MEDSARGKNRRASGSDEIGWGAGPVDDAEDLGARRMLFAVLCSVVVLIGAVFMYDSLRGGPAPARATMMASQGRYTVHLRTVDKEVGGQWQQVADAMLEEHGIEAESFTVAVDGTEDEVAVCVGRFKEPRSELAARVVEQCSSWTSPQGHRHFKDARVIDLE